MFEYFFKRSRFRRSRRLRSFRSALTKQRTIPGGSDVTGASETGHVDCATKQTDIDSDLVTVDHTKQTFLHSSVTSQTDSGRFVTSQRQEDEIQRLRCDIQRLQSELTDCQVTVDTLRRSEATLRDRLAEQAQRQLARGASSKFEDLSLGEKRVTQLIQKYGDIYAETRLEAIDALDTLSGMALCDELKEKLLLSVIVWSFRGAQSAVDRTRLQVRQVLCISDLYHGVTSASDCTARDLQQLVDVYLTQTIDKFDTSHIFQEVMQQVCSALYDLPYIHQCSALLTYIRECVQVAWALSVQRPCVHLDLDTCRVGSAFRASRHARFHTSDPQSVTITQVLWPPLVEDDNSDTCVYKGTVVT